MTTPHNQSTGTGPHDEETTEVATTWFVRMISDRASEEDRRAFQEWFDRDPAHRRAYAEAEALWDELGGIPVRRQGASSPGEAPQAAGRSESVIWQLRRHRLRRSVAIAAGLLLAASLGLWSFGSYDRLRADHATAVGEIRAVTLPDGSIVHLNTDTALAIDFAVDRRRVRLYRGEAYFVVAADKGRPFEVAAAAGIARAVGTAFDVQREGEAVTVAVAEGHVRVSREREALSRDDSAVLGPGDALRYTADWQIARQRVDVSALTAWQQGKLVFTDRPLRAVVAELDRYRPGAIVFLNSAIAHERFSGVVSLADTDQALAAIESTLPVDVIRLTGYLTVLRARD